jgi:hypothetical protein
MQQDLSTTTHQGSYMVWEVKPPGQARLQDWPALLGRGADTPALSTHYQRTVALHLQN